jgi:hypothetical protein
MSMPFIRKDHPSAGAVPLRPAAGITLSAWLRLFSMGHKARDPRRETSRHRLRMAPGMRPNTSMLRRSVIQHSIVSTFSQVLIRTRTVGARHAPGNAQQCKPGHHRLYWLSQSVFANALLQALWHFDRLPWLPLPHSRSLPTITTAYPCTLKSESSKQHTSLAEESSYAVPPSTCVLPLPL